jgi:hypothetical protein
MNLSIHASPLPPINPHSRFIAHQTGIVLNHSPKTELSFLMHRFHNRKLASVGVHTAFIKRRPGPAPIESWARLYLPRQRTIASIVISISVAGIGPCLITRATTGISLSVRATYVSGSWLRAPPNCSPFRISTSSSVSVEALLPQSGPGNRSILVSRLNETMR